VTATAPEQAPPARSRLAGLVEDYPDFGLLVTTLGILVAMVVIFSFTAERFFSLAVLVNILTQTSIYVIAGVGLTIVLTGAGIDISIGSIVGVAATMMGILVISEGYPGIVGILAALLVGAACGVFNGFLVAVIRVPPIIVTLGTLTFFRGLAYLLGGGDVYFRFPDYVTWLGSGRILGLPVPVYIAALTAIWGHVFLKMTRTGQRIVAVGGNEEAARLAGISVVWHRWLTYIISGLLTGLMTVVIVARQDAAQPVMGFGIELHILAAVILGGTSLFGGRGVVIGTVLGALILGVLQTGLLFSGVVEFWQLVSLGLLLIVVVALRIAREGTDMR
jgi:ribose transport system permease protein